MEETVKAVLGTISEHASGPVGQAANSKPKAQTDQRKGTNNANAKKCVVEIEDGWSIAVPEGFSYSNDIDKNGESSCNPRGRYDLIIAQPKSNCFVNFDDPYSNRIVFVTLDRVDFMAAQKYYDYKNTPGEWITVTRTPDLTVKYTLFNFHSTVSTYQVIVESEKICRRCQILINARMKKEDRAAFVEQMLSTIEPLPKSDDTKYNPKEIEEQKRKQEYEERCRREAEECARKAAEEAERRKKADEEAERERAEAEAAQQIERQQGEANGKRKYEQAVLECDRRKSAFEKSIKEELKRQKERVVFEIREKLNQKLADERTRFESLGFFKFGEKSDCKKTIAYLQGKLDDLQNDSDVVNAHKVLQEKTDNAIKQYQNEIAKYLDLRFKTDQRQVTKIFDKRPKQSVTDPQEKTVLSFVFHHWQSVTDIMKYTYNMSNQTVTRCLNALYLKGQVEKRYEKVYTYYALPGTSYTETEYIYTENENEITMPYPESPTPSAVFGCQ